MSITNIPIAYYRLLQVIQQELDNENSELDSLIAIATEAGLWPTGEQVPAPLPPVVSGWQPIATAPKDGTLILVCKDGESIQQAVWNRGDMMCMPHWMTPGQLFRPTHWHPAPPTSEAR